LNINITVNLKFFGIITVDSVLFQKNYAKEISVLAGFGYLLNQSMLVSTELKIADNIKWKGLCYKIFTYVYGKSSQNTRTEYRSRQNTRTEY